MKPEIKTGQEITFAYLTLKTMRATNKITKETFEEYKTLKWIPLYFLRECLKNRIESTEIAGYKNPIDEVYYNAVVSIYNKWGIWID